MKLIKSLSIILLTLLSITACSVRKIKRTDLEKKHLRGKVKSVKMTKYKTIAKKDKIEKGQVWGNIRKYTFNYQGYIVEETLYKNGTLGERYTYQYDDKGNQIKRSWYNSDGSLEDKTTYLYDDRGNKVKRDCYNSDGSLRIKWTYQYNDRNKLIKLAKYNADGSLRFKNIYQYDDRGNKFRQDCYKSDGSLRYKNTWKYQYDNQGNWVRKIEYQDGNPEFILEQEIEYYD